MDANTKKAHKLAPSQKNRFSYYAGEDMIGDEGFGTTEHALKSARDALWAIANMQITENTDKSEVLALCMSIARLELEKMRD